MLNVRRGSSLGPFRVFRGFGSRVARGAKEEQARGRGDGGRGVRVGGEGLENGLGAFGLAGGEQQAREVERRGGVARGDGLQRGGGLGRAAVGEQREGEVAQDRAGELVALRERPAQRRQERRGLGVAAERGERAGAEPGRRGGVTSDE